MASFQKYETKKGTLWYFVTEGGIDPETGDRKQIKRRGFKTKKEAQATARMVEQDIADDNFIGNSGMTFRFVYEKWREQQKSQVKPSTHYSVGSKFNKYILPAFGELKIQDITKQQCQKFINELSNTMLNKRNSKTKKRKPLESPEKRQFKSINEYKMYTTQLFQFAIDEGFIKKNPMTNVKVPKIKEDFTVDLEDSTRENFWDKEAVLRFYKTLEEFGNEFDKMYFPLLISTGMRKAEALALTWDDIDLNAKTIHICKTLYFQKGEFQLLKPKTKKSDRTISVDDGVIKKLKEWKIQQSKVQNINVIKKGNVISFQKKSAPLIFTRNDSSPIRLPYPNERLNILIEKGSLPELTVHGLRHTHASLLFEAGASIKEVQVRLGHSDVKMTLNIYTHVSKAVKEATAEKFKNFMQIS